MRLNDENWRGLVLYLHATQDRLVEVDMVRKANIYVTQYCHTEDRKDMEPTRNLIASFSVRIMPKYRNESSNCK